MIKYWFNIIWVFIKKKNFDRSKHKNKQQKIFPTQKTESSYFGFFIPPMIFCTCFQNHFGFLRTSYVKFSRLRCCQISSSRDAMSSLRTFFVTRARCLARTVRCLLQSLKFSTQCKAASEAILSVKSILTFFNKSAICHLTFSLTSWVHPQVLNRSRAFLSSVVAATDWSQKFF